MKYTTNLLSQLKIIYSRTCLPKVAKLQSQKLEKDHPHTPHVRSSSAAPAIPPFGRHIHRAPDLRMRPLWPAGKQLSWRVLLAFWDILDFILLGPAVVKKRRATKKWLQYFRPKHIRGGSFMHLHASHRPGSTRRSWLFAATP